jgi:predicted amidophosphoribosyltransferase
VRRAVHRLKFGGWRAVAEALAEAMARTWSGETWPADVVTWVPLSRERLAARGYDQARALARAVAPLIGVRAEPLVRRVGDPGPQARRGGAARREAMRGVFGPAADVSGWILLVDDVLTTGATAGVCADALLAGGASTVGLLTVARAVSSARRPGPLYSASGSRPGLWLPRGTAPRQSMPAAGEATHVSRPLVGEHGAV